MPDADQLSARQLKMLGLLEESGGASVRELSVQCHVSEMTIRRELDRFEHHGFVRRHHGGAVVTRRSTFERPLAMRRVERREEKRRIAARAVERVHSRSSVALGNGSTTYELARLLGGFTDLTVLTPNIPIALALAEFPSVQTLVPGVTMRSGEASMIGPEAIDAIEQFYFDLAIIGAGGVEPSIGVTEYNSDEATVIRTMVRRSAECIVLADSSKLGRIAPVVVSELERVNGMITTTEADPSIVADLRAAGVEVELT